ncbi:tRNA pseudouridine(38-40) synthase TruA [Luteithermobacter gelatinilyticus]|uniref:tRNA pseudouridine(38-40) synthase TruA n=1 Tax=Luteithermobacter gelatinilyticus TaxID=2582913 RepID=UPI001106C055|nr:tRNA pseudouridine(38-40) synthase TruA [Luteithermobacter gelatinilyticus]|tara:strand:- start:31049 stop:31807 length:759 start_codon:yes stop_codon:yes gene_type:complete
MSETFRYKLTLEYDGSSLVGWQYQTNGPSVQGLLEDATRKFCPAYNPAESRYVAAGRTDAGVHALAMVAHVDLPQEVEARRLCEALNHFLNRGPVAVLEAEPVSQEFHARFSAKRRAYRYHIINRRAPLTLMRHKAWHVKHPLDTDAMHEAAQQLVGRHDFTTFRSVQCQSRSPVKTLDRLDVRREGENIYVETSARSFLHHQVRSMVGCLYYVGLGKWSKQDLKEALEAADRTRLAYNAPPDGLYFTGVDY